MVAPPDIETVITVAGIAGQEILEWYGKDVPTEHKEDQTPLTAADRAAHESILAGLRTMAPEVPVLSEESAAAETRERRSWSRYWLVDPLDGTKEFLKGTGEFTVNIALIEGGRPTLGVVHAPVLGRTYVAAGGRAYRLDGSEKPRPIGVRRFDPERPIVVASRDHSGPAVEAFAQGLGPSVEFTSMGSSLKFCLVAEGRADVYLRDGPTMEWDTGAAQSVVEAAGGAVFSIGPHGLGTALRYNKQDLRNPGFLCVGDLEIEWSRRWEDDLV